MSVIASRVLRDYAERHPITKAPLSHWLSVARAATWSSSNDVRLAFAKAVILNGERVRFEVAGGSHRLIVAFDFNHQIAFIKFIGTHAEYDEIDALTVSQF